MLVNELGSYAPEPFFLTHTLRAQARFHDPEGVSLFSNSGTVAHYRQWSSDSTHDLKRLNITASDLAQKYEGPDLLVRSSRPIMSQSVEGVDVKQDGYYEGHLPSLVTPKSKAIGGNTKRVRYAVLEVSRCANWVAWLLIPGRWLVATSTRQQQYVPGWWVYKLPSNNYIHTEDHIDWLSIATEIELNYSSYDGFIILHGTDTMCYTSSALSFLLEDLGKTVVRTFTPRQL